jgi:acetylglutamate kinase
MSYAAHHKVFDSVITHQARPQIETVAKKTGILQRMFDAFSQSRQRAVDRQIARFVAARWGGTLTDSLEREISQRVLTSNWNVNAEPFGNRRFP